MYPETLYFLRLINAEILYLSEIKLRKINKTWAVYKFKDGDSIKIEPSLGDGFRVKTDGGFYIFSYYVGIKKDIADIIKRNGYIENLKSLKQDYLKQANNVDKKIECYKLFIEE